MTGSGPTAWHVLRGSVRGLNKKFNQDSLYTASVADGAALVLSVADGHGSAAHFRSDMGSRWAVREFADCVTPFARTVVDRQEDPTTWLALFAAARALAGPICHRWRERALLYEAGHPANGAAAGERNPTRADLIPYGTTLLGLVVTQQLLFCWQVGDGDITTSADAGAPPRRPLATAEEEYGDDTDSLCEPEPWVKMRVHCQPMAPLGPRPLLIANTDGLSKSFEDERGYLKFATDVHSALERQGIDKVRLLLEGWLTRAAGKSGDDTTLVGVYAGE